MKFAKKLVLGSLIATASAMSFAAPTAELRVIGTIIPGACTPTFGGTGTVDFGNIASTSLNTAAQTVLASKSTTLTVACDAPTKFSIESTDNRSTSVVADAKPSATLDESHHYGLGNGPAGAAGNFILKTSNEVGDGAAITRLVSSNSSATWDLDTGEKAVKPSAVHRIAFAPSGVLVPAPFSSVTMNVEVIPAFVKSEDLDLSQEILLDGSTTFTVHYE